MGLMAAWAQVLSTRSMNCFVPNPSASWVICSCRPQWHEGLIMSHENHAQTYPLLGPSSWSCFPARSSKDSAQVDTISYVQVEINDSLKAMRLA